MQSQRASLLLVLLAFVSAAVLRDTHGIAVPHRWCEVHSALEHGPEVAASVAPAAETDGPTIQPAPETHEECGLVAFARTDAALVLDPPSAVRPLLELCRASLAPAEIPPRDSLYLEAPSRSPPG